MKRWIHFLSCFIPSQSKRKHFRKMHLLPSFPVRYGKETAHNSIIVSPLGDSNPKRLYGIEVQFFGKNNTLEIIGPCVFERGVKILFYGDNCSVQLNKCRVVNCVIELNNGARMTVGENSSIGGKFYLVNEENTSISIGKDCMFSGEVVFWPTDGHQILDKERCRCLNKSKHGIIVGDHVWIGYRTLILKNVMIPNNCIVGAGAVVSRSFDEENIIIAGNPAKKVKSGINWDRKEPI